MRVKRVFLLTFGLLYIISHTVYAQGDPALADSLYKVAGELKDKSYFLHAASVYRQIQGFPTWMENAENARKLFNSTAFVYYKAQQYDSSAYFYQKSNEMAVQLQDTTRIIASYNSLALAYRLLGFYSKAIDNNQQALLLAKASSDFEKIIDIANTTGLIYYNLKQFDQALDTHRDALLIAFEIRDSARMAAMYNNIAMSHFDLGYYDSSLYYNTKSLHLKKLLNIPRAEHFSTLNNIGEDYLAMDSLDLAEQYLSEAYQICIESENVEEEIATLSNLAELALKRGDYRLADRYLNHVSALLKKVYVKDLYLDYLALKTALLEKQGTYRDALKSYKELSALQEEIFQSEQLDVQRVEASYALREKDLEAQNLAQEIALAKAASRRNAQLVLFLLLGLVAASVVAFFFIRLNRKLADSYKLIQLQKLDLKHSTFNMLNRIQSMLRITSYSLPDTESREKLYQVESAILSAASLQHFTYGIEHTDEGSLGEFLKELVGSLKEAFSSSGHTGISYLVEIRDDAVLPVTTLLNCGMMVGEIVTNAVKYAFVSEPEPKISVCLSRLDSCLLLQVGDNGKGMRMERKNDGVGADLIRKLARLMKAELIVDNNGGTWYRIKFKA